MNSKRTFEMAAAFLTEMRRDLERAAVEGSDLPPRIRSVHERAGHATPEYRTLAVPVQDDMGGQSPEILSEAIARYAVSKRPDCLFLVLDAVTMSPEGAEQPVLIAEARDRLGTRLFFVQPYRADGQRVDWDEPIEGGWRDPGKEEMILDAAFPSS
ncbi:MAG TPA: hypothetical protein VFI91_04565 [Longimicrobiaceae bacterium]|nr:hypothetical protein [Longimicrobiaceae bacterium]